MLRKKLFTAFSAIFIMLTIFYIWNNILILDDNHLQYSDVIETESYILQASEENNLGTDNNIKTDSMTKGVTPIKKGYHIHINLDTLIMYVYKNGQLIKSYPVSGGKTATPSPLGTWKIITKDTWGEGFGGAWLGFNVPWGKYGIHGTYYPWFIGKSNSSEGCIRMKNNDVKELFKLVPHGTIVTIVYDNPAFRILKSGVIGSDVVNIQKALKKLGYYNGGVDGKFGNGLMNAVIKYQKDNKLYANGVINKRTYDSIIEKEKLNN